MNNILITGGSGYVGSRLTFNLLEKDKNINKIVLRAPIWDPILINK